MSWKQCSIPVGFDHTDIRMQVSAFAEAKGHPADFALFGRIDDETSSELLLLSPLAVKMMGNILSPLWIAVVHPERFGWSLLFGHVGCHSRLGLKTPGELAGDS